jgi:hypothetical protein
MGQPIDTGDVELWTERRGQGPDVLLIAGLGDPIEAWQPQLDGGSGPQARSVPRDGGRRPHYLRRA